MLSDFKILYCIIFCLGFVCSCISASAVTCHYEYLNISPVSDLFESNARDKLLSQCLVQTQEEYKSGIIKKIQYLKAVDKSTLEEYLVAFEKSPAEIQYTLSIIDDYDLSNIQFKNKDLIEYFSFLKCSAPIVCPDSLYNTNPIK